ncbi:MAG TPA: hypothetical protein ENJ84_05870 [Gammaproteobacteria bacterium]|nr:hypothetical protein [Gammaproteobacteria bacterium]
MPKIITILTFLAVLVIIPLTGFDQSTASAPRNLFAEPLPEALTIMREVNASTDCAMGGRYLMYGLDYDGDGQLSPYERQGVNLMCNPLPVALGHGRTLASAPHPARSQSAE